MSSSSASLFTADEISVDHRDRWKNHKNEISLPRLIFFVGVLGLVRPSLRPTIHTYITCILRFRPPVSRPEQAQNAHFQFSPESTSCVKEKIKTRGQARLVLVVQGARLVLVVQGYRHSLSIKRLSDSSGNEQRALLCSFCSRGIGICCNFPKNKHQHITCRISNCHHFFQPSSVK